MKRPKTVKVFFRESVGYYAEYTCPACKTTFMGAGVTSATTRFLCDCGQELIVDRQEVKK